MNVPGSTYRLQFNAQFTFEHARAIVDYLSEMGISAIYASPVFTAKKGSLHGYDVADFDSINAEMGGEEAFNNLTDAVHRKGLSWIQDFVPNHMSYSCENRMLMDVLERGKESRYYQFFDIEWEHPHEGLQGRVLAPFLGTFYAEALQSRQLGLVLDDEGLGVSYYDWRFPLKLETYGEVLEPAIGRLREQLGENHPQVIALQETLSRLQAGSNVFEAKAILLDLVKSNTTIRRCIEDSLAQLQGKGDDPSSFDALDALLVKQPFKFAFWKVASEEINYRRFFVINDLICMRVERPEVFSCIHEKLFSLIRDGRIDGVRIDHIDGLYDPYDYLMRLRENIGDRYLVVEKILDVDETIRPEWPVQGSTGYDYLTYLNGLFCKTESQSEFVRLYHRFTGINVPLTMLSVGKKRLTIERHMAGTIHLLVHQLQSLAARDRYGRDIMPFGLQRALEEVMAQFPVYRTYISSPNISEVDRELVMRATQRAHDNYPGIDYEIRFIKKYLLQDFDVVPSESERADALRFVMRFQQCTGPLMAKGFEDTALYIYNRLLAQNEVGGSPDLFGIPVERFHSFCLNRGEQSPHSMNASATHDTKRGEDVRARLNVLSEMPGEWERNLKTWSSRTRSFRLPKSGIRMDPNDEYSLYQSLVGSFPFDESEIGSFGDRMREYVVKALREAKVHTAWIKPDTAYEQCCVDFITAVLDPKKGKRFLEAFLPFQRTIAFYGVINSLSQVALKILSPGLPDFYQGTELWDFSLVDPDNRREVDFARRRDLLSDIVRRENAPQELISHLLETYRSGQVKMFLIRRLLQFRRANLELFQSGEYMPLAISGVHGSNVIAFVRRIHDQTAILVAPRFPVSLCKEGSWPLGKEVWGDTALISPLGSKSLRDVVTGERIDSAGSIPVSQALSSFPVAVLTDIEE